MSVVLDVSNLRIFTEPQQGATYDDLLAVARRAEQLGFGAFFRSDHYLAMGGALEAGGLPGPSDAWITLAGLARDTTTIRLGTLVSSATFRLPGVLAITVANVDQMSGGRVELGLGSRSCSRRNRVARLRERALRPHARRPDRLLGRVRRLRAAARPRCAPPASRRRLGVARPRQPPGRRSPTPCATPATGVIGLRGRASPPQRRDPPRARRGPRPPATDPSSSAATAPSSSASQAAAMARTHPEAGLLFVDGHLDCYDGTTSTTPARAPTWNLRSC